MSVSYITIYIFVCLLFTWIRQFLVGRAHRNSDWHQLLRARNSPSPDER